MNKKAIKSLVVMLIAVMFVSMMPVKAFAATKKPAKVKVTSVKITSVSTSNNMTTMTIKWKKAARATGYIVYAKHGDGEWVKQKKVGRLARKLTLKNTPAGQIYVRVRAVNKKKLGKYSAIKSKYITSPLSVQQYVDRVEPSAKNLNLYGGTTSFVGKQMVVSYDLEEILPGKGAAFWQSLDESQKASLRNILIDDLHAKELATKYRRYFNVSCGIKNFGFTSRFVHEGVTIVSVSY